MSPYNRHNYLCNCQGNPFCNFYSTYRYMSLYNYCCKPENMYIDNLQNKYHICQKLFL